MSTYELDDDLVRKFIAHQNQAGWGNAIADKFAVELLKQLPLPTPAGIGAVVRTNGFPSAYRPEPSVFIRWAPDHQAHSPWIEADNHEHPYGTDEIGRIVEVLSEGVDLDS